MVALTGVRVLADLLAGGVVVAGGLGLSAAAAFALVGERRYGRFVAAAARDASPRRLGGVALALGAVFTVVCALLGGVVVVGLRVGALSLG